MFFQGTLLYDSVLFKILIWTIFKMVMNPVVSIMDESADYTSPQVVSLNLLTWALSLSMDQILDRLLNPSGFRLLGLRPRNG